jgi:predicted nucleotidyltransferase
MAEKQVELLEGTNALKAFKFLCEHTGRDFMGSDIQKATGISRVGVFLIMRQLIKEGFVKIEKRGRLGLYSADYTNPAVKQFKVLINVIEIQKKLMKIADMSISIILYGSCARGEDTADSDIDIFIETHDPDSVREALKNVKLKRKLQSVIKTPVEMVVFREKEAVYINEVNRGIKLWEKRDEH